MLSILLATSNPHKLAEIRAVFADAAQRRREQRLPGFEVQVMSLADAGVDVPEPVEDQATFEGNAVLKARYYAGVSGMRCLADDSGLEVDALAGEPGVRSARYASVAGERAAVDLANNRLLLEKLAHVPLEKRSARFVCAMALCRPARGDAHAPDEPEALVRGSVEGRIITPDEAADRAHPERGRGDNGFGYDPLFCVPALGRTTAELTPEHKNRISHRGAAARLMWDELVRLFAG